MRSPLLVLLLLPACTSLRVERSPSSASAATRFLLPPPKEARDGTGVFVPGGGVELRNSDGDSTGQDLLREELPSGGSGRVVLERLPDWSSLGRDLGPEGYVLDVTPAGVHAQAVTGAGLFYAAQTLLQLSDGGSIPAVHITDWPDVKDRMVLYDLRLDGFNLAYMKRWIHELSRLKINQFMLFLSGDYQYRKYPFVAPASKLTPEKLREFRAYARAHHVQVIPQVESLGHADGALAHEEFRDIRLTPDNHYAYSPCTPRTYTVLGDFYRELSAETDSDIFHVGGDEVWGFDTDPRCSAHSDDDQARLYSQHLQKLSSILRPLHRRMGIWSDMILKHPLAAEGLSRDTVIFDWDYSEDYKRFDDFPSLAKFKAMGFRDIYATAAVLGFNDMYPLLPVAFQNIRGFTQAALREDIHSVCVTIWEMQPGNNAENYLYGLSWAGNILWSSRSTDLADFNRRFASVWFGIRSSDAASHVDRALWFPWRVSGDSVLTEKDSSGFWQIEHRTAELLYMPFGEFAGFYGIDDLRRLPSEADALVHSLDAAAGSVVWLHDHARRNSMTVQSMEMTNVFYRFLAFKVRALSRLALDYGDAYAAGDVARGRAALSAGLRDLSALRARFPVLRGHLARAVRERNRGPEELATLGESLKSLDAFSAVLRSGLSAGQLPEPAKLGLAPKVK